MIFVSIVAFVLRPRSQRVEGWRGAEALNGARRSVARAVAGALTFGGCEGFQRRFGNHRDEDRRRSREGGLPVDRPRRPIDEDHMTVIIVKRCTRRLMGTPV